MTDDLAAVNEPRRLLRDAIWNHGPEHFDLARAFTGALLSTTWTTSGWPIMDGITADERWTACLWGHAKLLTPDVNPWTHYGLDVGSPMLLGQVTTGVTVDGWSLDDDYTERVASGQDRRTAQFWTCIEYLDRLIKRDEQ